LPDRAAGPRQGDPPRRLPPAAGAPARSRDPWQAHRADAARPPAGRDAPWQSCRTRLLRAAMSDRAPRTGGTVAPPDPAAPLRPCTRPADRTRTAPTAPAARRPRIQERRRRIRRVPEALPPDRGAAATGPAPR